MAMKTLVLGLLFSSGVFAVKAGAGLAYLWGTRPGIRWKAVTAAAMVAGYGLAFLAAGYILFQVNLVARLDRVMAWMKHGMTLHLVMAALLLIWGTVLLKKNNQPDDHSHGWLLLALPCPVCFTVILFGSAMLVHLVPGNPWILAWPAGAFSGLVLVTAVLSARYARGRAACFLGAVMVGAALYFLVTVALVPHFSDMERIYRLSRHTGEILVPEKRTWLLMAGLSVLFAAGLFRSVRRI